MPYYVLNNGFALRGWKGKPFGLGYPNPHFVDFFDKESYEVVYALDGRHDIREDEHLVLGSIGINLIFEKKQTL